MNVYIETNFIIEFARLQDQHAGCEGILKLAEENRINLIVPAFGVEESYGAWGRKRGVRAELTNKLAQEDNYLTASELYRHVGEKFKAIYDLFREAQIEEIKRLNMAISRVLERATVISLDPDILSAAAIYQGFPLMLSPQDSVIYAAVLSNLALTSADTPKCFLNKNRRDFYRDDIRSELLKHRCLVISNFNSGFDHIKKHI